MSNIHEYNIVIFLSIIFIRTDSEYVKLVKHSLKCETFEVFTALKIQEVVLGFDAYQKFRRTLVHPSSG